MIELDDRNLMRDRCYVDGRWVRTDSTFDVVDPASGVKIAAVADAGPEVARGAVASAEAAWPDWRRLTGKQRATMLKRFHALIVENAEDLARIVTAEMGKPLREARGEIASGADYVEWYAEEAKRAYGRVVPGHIPGMRLVVAQQPIGVAVSITPWNFPFSTIARKVAPALAAGCPVVVKPAEDTPLSALAMAELADRAGFPPGIFNVVTAGDPAPVGRELTTNPSVRKVSFTGSTEVGRLLMEQGSTTIKKLSLELGGNAPFIVFDDADIDAAIAGAMICKYRNGGQTCICANRVYVHEAVAAEFAGRLTAAASALIVGDGWDDATDVGPLINDQAMDKVVDLVGDAVERGATVMTGGAPHPRGKRFFSPTVLDGVTPDMPIANDEVFGPVATLFSFSDEDEVVAAANETPYGLAAYVYTRDNARVWRVSEALDYGMVGVNTGVFMTEVAPFGGIKQSGFGREGGPEGLSEFLTPKLIATAI
jgi:succinate-semialdehyde dehydrogenase/glutarate-semialdehyde dehydrogenase